MKRFVSLCAAALAVGVSACGSGGGAFVFDKLEYPVSMSPALNAPGGAPAKSDDLRVVGTVEVRKRLWEIFWGFIPLSGSVDMGPELNEQIKAKGGDGVVRLSATVENCGLPNNVPLLNILPVWPGCAIGVLRGDVVKYVGAAPAAGGATSFLTPVQAGEEGAKRLDAALGAFVANAKAEREAKATAATR